MNAASGVTRLESDTFGSVEVPQDALWGVQTQRCLENMSFSGRRLGDYRELVTALALIKRAAAEANVKAGVLEGTICQLISSACQEILSGEHLDHFPVDILAGGGGVGINMNTNEVIAKLANRWKGSLPGTYAPVHPFRHVNASQSTADVCHTAYRLAICSAFEGLSAELEALSAVMAQRAADFEPVLTMGRTCLRDALPVSLGSLFAGYASMIERRTKELAASVDKLSAVNLGGTVLGSGAGAPAGYRLCVLDILSHLSGRSLSHRLNLYDAAQNIDDLAVVSSSIRHLAGALMKVARDLRLLASGPQAGLSEIRLPTLQAGSSFFANKANPLIPETMIHCCLQVIGNDRAVQAACEGGELNLNVFEPVAFTNIMDSLRMLGRAVTLFRRLCLEGLEADLARCASYVRQLSSTLTG